MTYTVPTQEPDAIRSGEDWHWTIVLGDFPPSEGWTLTYYFNGRGALTILATIAADGNSYDVSALAAVTGDPAKIPVPLAIGDRYTWDAVVSKAGPPIETHVARSGVITVLPKLVGAANGAFQTHAEVMLAAIEAALTGRLTTEQMIETYGVAGRQVAKVPVDKLTRLRAQYMGMVRRERNPNRIGTPVEAVTQLPS